MDFNDLVNNVVYLFRRHPERSDGRAISYILVDEYGHQAQFEVIHRPPSEKCGCRRRRRQSIYSFHEADIGNITSFEEHYPAAKVVLLEQSRSSSRILKAAMAVVKSNRGRDKELWTEAAERRYPADRRRRRGARVSTDCRGSSTPHWKRGSSI